MRKSGNELSTGEMTASSAEVIISESISGLTIDNSLGIELVISESDLLPERILGD